MKDPKIVLSLSGGGVRAMAFHLGVLKFLAEQQAFKKIKAISTVSGGTLLIGLILAKNNYNWPTSDEFLNNVYPKLYKHLQNISLTMSMEKGVKSAIDYVKFLGPNPNKSFENFSKYLRDDWKIKGRVDKLNLKSEPNWIINGTSVEKGVRVYFNLKSKILKCYLENNLKDIDITKVYLSDIVAMSAAVPAFIGPYEPKIKTNDTVHIYDGGIYDNLGTEEFLRVGNGELKPLYENCVLLVSDAGAPLDDTYPEVALMRFKKFFDIAANQVRALRVSDFNQNFLRKQKGFGAHFRIGVKIKALLRRKDCSQATNYFAKKNVEWQTKTEVEKAASADTAIRKLEEDELKLLTVHGYEVSKFFTKQQKVKGFF